MSSDGKDIDPSKNLQERRGNYPDDIDLDKNPIKYANSDGTLSEDAHDKEYMELTLRSGRHSELVQKLLRQRIEARAKEFPRWPAEQTSGARLMWIESRFWHDRERLGPDFDDDWRNYRAKYLNSLELDPREPLRIQAYDHALINPIRRFYMKGGDFIEDKIIRKFFTQNKYKSSLYRVTATRLFALYVVSIGAYYYFRFCESKWNIRNGHYSMVSHPIVLPSNKNFPFKDYKTEPCHYWDKGFTRRTIFKNLSDFEDNTALL